MLAELVFLALVALERINAETTKLVKKLDLVGIEISRTSTVVQTARERLESDQLHSSQNEDKGDDDLKAKIQKMAMLQYAEDQSKTLAQAEKNMMRQMATIKMMMKSEAERGHRMMLAIDVHTNDIINRQEISTEYQYLQNIISELRDQAESKKIFGLVVDRPMLSRFFGGLVAVVYIILKDTADRIIAQYAPPSPMTISAGGYTAGDYVPDRVSGMLTAADDGSG